MKIFSSLISIYYAFYIPFQKYSFISRRCHSANCKIFIFINIWSTRSVWTPFSLFQWSHSKSPWLLHVYVKRPECLSCVCISCHTCSKLQPFSNIIFFLLWYEIIGASYAMFVCFKKILTSYSKIFHLCEEVISIGEGLQDLGKARHL